MLYIVLIGLFCFWVHAQIHHGLLSRLLSSLALFTFAILMVIGFYRISNFYAKAPIFQALENMNYDRDADQKADYERMIEHYKFDSNADISYLVEETGRLKAKYAKLNQVEPAGDEQPATQPADKAPVKDQPSTPTSKVVPR